MPSTKVLAPSLLPSTKASRPGILARSASFAAGTFRTVEEAQVALCPQYRVFEPKTGGAYEDLYAAWRKLYFAFGQKTGSMGDVLPLLRETQRRKNAAAVIA